MLFRVDPAKSIPLGSQIAACVRRAIVEGSVSDGERLPSARELASSLEISLHTVLAGYQQLRDEGLVELRRGRGATVRTGPAAAEATIAELIENLVHTARRLDVGDEELVTRLRAAIAAE